MRTSWKYVVLTMMMLVSLHTSASDRLHLNQSFDLRLSDRHTSLTLLQRIDQDALSSNEKDKYDYLRFYHDILAGNITSSVEELQSLEAQVTDPELKLTILSTLLSTYVAVKAWHSGFADIDKVNQLFEDNPALENSELGLRVKNGMGVFFNAAEEFARAADMAESVINNANKPSSLCIAHNIILQALEAQQSYEKFDRYFEQGLEYCSQAGMRHITSGLHFSKARQKSQIWETQRTIDYALEHLNFASEEGFLPLIHAYQSFLAQQYCLIEDFQNCLLQAYEVIRTGSDNSYIIPRLHSYESAALASAELGLFENAHKYWKEFAELQREYYSEVSARQNAVQNARFNDEAKRAQIALLDKENSLLQTEAKLATEQIQNTLLALALSAFLLLALILWSWRAMLVQNKLKIMARVDSLTEVANRGYFTEVAKSLLEKAKPNRKTVAIILFDLDHFKRINDNYGHHVGDWALKSTVRAIESVLPSQATLGRVGGEEFAIFVDGLSLEQSTNLAEACRAAVEKIDPEEIHRTKFTLTASFGVCDSTQVGYSYDTLYTAADLALYQSKTRGRNTVYVYAHNAEGV